MTAPDKMDDARALLTDEDRKWLDLIRKELFWALDRATTSKVQSNRNARIDAFDKLLALAAPASHDAQRVDYDRELIADMLESGGAERGVYLPSAVAEQTHLLREAEDRDGAGVHTAKQAMSADGWAVQRVEEGDLYVITTPDDLTWIVEPGEERLHALCAALSTQQQATAALAHPPQDGRKGEEG